MTDPKLYLVIAYRWGNTNDHWYIVYNGDDRGKAIALGENEREGRGSKYGVAVFEVTERGESLEMIEYFASSKEPEPSTNWRIEMFERLGHVLYDYARYHYINVRDPDNPGCLKRVEITPDPALVVATEYQEQFADKMQKAMDKARAERRERAAVVFCPICDQSPVYEVEYSCNFWRVPRNPEGGTIEVNDLEGNWCRNCEQMHLTPAQVHRNWLKVNAARTNDAVGDADE